MKWAYGIKNKLMASSVLLALCVLALYSNYIDRNHTQNVKNAISTLYEDRLVAEVYILKMSGEFYQIKEVLNSDANETYKANTINNLLLNINEIINAYQKTKFTDLEQSTTDELLKIIRDFESAHSIDTQLKLKAANNALKLLNELSTIQLEVSKQIMEKAEALYLFGKASSQFVFALIFIILLVLQGIVFTSKTLIINYKTEDSQLN